MLKKFIAMYASSAIAVLSVVLANTDSAAFVNKPEVPAELKK